MALRCFFPLRVAANPANEAGVLVTGGVLGFGPLDVEAFQQMLVPSWGDLVEPFDRARRNQDAAVTCGPLRRRMDLDNCLALLVAQHAHLWPRRQPEDRMRHHGGAMLRCVRDVVVSGWCKSSPWEVTTYVAEGDCVAAMRGGEQPEANE